MEAIVIKGTSLGIDCQPLLPQLGNFYSSDMDAHILFPGKIMESFNHGDKHTRVVCREMAILSQEFGDIWRLLYNQVFAKNVFPIFLL